MMSLLELLHRKPPAPDVLANLLADLSIEPFDAPSVERYKAQKKEELFLALLPATLRWGFLPVWEQTWRPTKPSVAEQTGWVLSLTSEERRILKDKEGWDVRFYREKMGMSTPLMIAVRWHRMSLAEAVATLGVPEYVVNKAAQILDKNPDAVMHVDSLETESGNYDPFLIVELGREQYYVEVWGNDEKEFQR